ncbi:MAG: methyltransferase domain-containing protein [Lentisphaerae bacterium]|nr:methyltransferase domain-containing protein [Lentisphaerota bacterium]
MTGISHRADSMAARFSAAASTYDHSADIQRQTAKKVMNLMSGFAAAVNVIEIGCGTGILTRLLIKRFPSARIECVDISDAMIRVACDRIGSGENVIFSTLDIGEKSAQFDLAVSNAALHWMVPLKTAFAKLNAVLCDGAHIAFSIMLDGTLAELKSARARVASHKQIGMKLPARTEILEGLGINGFMIMSEARETAAVIYDSAWSFLKTIHNQGVTGGIYSGQLLNRTELTMLVEDYDRSCRIEDGGVTATYEILYVLARKVNNG